MTDSIRLDEQQIDGLCSKYDPANIEQFRVLLNQIPDPDDRAFVLEHEQAYMRARIEVFAALRAVREWAVAAGDPLGGRHRPRDRPAYGVEEETRGRAPVAVHTGALFV